MNFLLQIQEGRYVDTVTNNAKMLEMFGFHAPPPLDVIPPFVPDCLATLLPFRRKTLLGNPQKTIGYTASRFEYQNARLVIDSVCNLHCKGPGQPLFWITGDYQLPWLLREKNPLSIIVKDVPLFKQRKKQDKLTLGEHNFYYGEYVYNGILQVEEGCYNDASVEGKKMMVEAMMGYTKDEGKVNCLPQWGFSWNNTMSEEEARNSIERDLISARPTSAFLYFDYVGMSELAWQEVEVCLEFKRVFAHGGDIELKAHKAIRSKEREKKKREYIKLHGKIIKNEPDSWDF